MVMLGVGFGVDVCVGMVVCDGVDVVVVDVDCVDDMCDGVMWCLIFL